ncbi:MAG: hypothetical protein AB8B53_13290 [Flavobacteriales bacterium]
MKTLTTRHFKQIDKDMKGSNMLSDSEILAIAHKVNAVINLPFVREEKELVVFVKLIKKLDEKLYELLPNEYYQLIRDAEDGISADEAESMEEAVTKAINKKINIPILSERLEAKLISLVVGIIINAMIKGFNLEEQEPV